jgi:AraC-like DNA-binding protein
MDIEEGPMEWLFITFELGSPDTIETLQSLKDAPRILPLAGIALLNQLTEEYTARKGRRRPKARAPSSSPAAPAPAISSARNKTPAADALAVSFQLSRLLRVMTTAPLLPVQRRNIHTTNQARDAVLEKINHYVRSHLSEAPTLRALAQALGYSASHLRSVFRNRLGVSLGRYIRESRLSQAAKQLQGTGLSISDIARQSGFDSPFSFSRTFKKAYGLSPKAYGKRLQARVSSSASLPSTSPNPP